jgi:hypothetical protein
MEKEKRKEVYPCGCRRLFEGTMEDGAFLEEETLNFSPCDVYQALVEKFQRLEAREAVYYREHGRSFTDNPAMLAEREDVERKLETHLHTIPKVESV